MGDCQARGAHVSSVVNTDLQIKGVCIVYTSLSAICRRTVAGGQNSKARPLCAPSMDGCCGAPLSHALPLLLLGAVSALAISDH